MDGHVAPPHVPMQLFDTTQIGLERALSGASARHAAIADNIANIDTPGYRRKDVDFHGVLADAFARGASAVEAAEPHVVADGSAAVRQDGSTVDIDVEAAAQARNGLEYEALAAVLKARGDIVKSAIGVA